MRAHSLTRVYVRTPRVSIQAGEDILTKLVQRLTDMGLGDSISAWLEVCCVGEGVLWVRLGARACVCAQRLTDMRLGDSISAWLEGVCG